MGCRTRSYSRRLRRQEQSRLRIPKTAQAYPPSRNSKFSRRCPSVCRCCSSSGRHYSVVTAGGDARENCRNRTVWDAQRPLRSSHLTRAQVWCARCTSAQGPNEIEQGTRWCLCSISLSRSTKAAASPVVYGSRATCAARLAAAGTRLVHDHAYTSQLCGLLRSARGPALPSWARRFKSLLLRSLHKSRLHPPGRRLPQACFDESGLPK